MYIDREHFRSTERLHHCASSKHQQNWTTPKWRHFLNQLKVQRTIQVIINAKVIFQYLPKRANSIKQAQGDAGNQCIFLYLFQFHSFRQICTQENWLSKSIAVQELISHSQLEQHLLFFVTSSKAPTRVHCRNCGWHLMNMGILWKTPRKNYLQN